MFSFQGLIDSIVTFYILNNNFFYTKVAFAYIADNTDAFFFFFFGKILISFTCSFQTLSFCF